MIVVRRESPIPASTLPLIDDPMTLALSLETVAGPYIYFTVTSPFVMCGRLQMWDAMMLVGESVPEDLAMTTPVPPSEQTPGE